MPGRIYHTSAERIADCTAEKVLTEPWRNWLQYGAELFYSTGGNIGHSSVKKILTVILDNGLQYVCKSSLKYGKKF